MIGRITGQLIEKRPPTVLVDVQGVAYEVDVPMSTFFKLPATGATVALHTHLIVREDAHLLFGFGTERGASGVPAVAQDQRRRRAHGAVGALRSVGLRAVSGRVAHRMARG